MKKIILLFLFNIFLFGLSPTNKIEFDGYISKVVFNKNYLVVGLENGEIIIDNFNTLKKVTSLKLPMIEDFMGDKIAMPIYSLDVKKNNVLILAGGEDSKREVFVFDIKNNKLNHLLSTKDTFMKASFIGKNIFFGFLSDEIGLWNGKKFIYKVQAGNYVFSTYSLNEDRTKVAIGDESGSLKIIDVQSGKKLVVLKGFNKDQTLSVDFRKNLVINGGSDKRVAIYDVNKKDSILELDVKFLPYGATISPNVKKFAIQYNEKNDIILYNIYKTKLAMLKGHTMALNGMKFVDDNTILSYSPAEILIWKLKEK